MEGLAKIIGRCWLLAALFAAAFHLANVAPMAWAKNTPATSDANQSPLVPSLDDPYGEMRFTAKYNTA